MKKVTASIDQISRDLQSADQPTRGHAMQDLLRQTESDPSVHPQAEALFREHLPAIADSWSAVMAARGLSHIGGEAEGLRAFWALVHRPEVQIVAHAALAMDHPRYVPALLDVLSRRQEAYIRSNVLRTLGRIGDVRALEVLVAELPRPATRPQAVCALGDLGDPRAIPHLERYLDDRADAWPEDNHGPMLSVADVADMAIRQLQAGHPRVREPLPRSEMNFTPPPARTISPAGTLKQGNRIAYLPSIVAVLEIPWIALAVFGAMSITGDTHLRPIVVQAVAVFCVFPPLGALMIGYAVMTRRSLSAKERLWFVIGCAACLIYVAIFTSQFMSS